MRTTLSLTIFLGIVLQALSRSNIDLSTPLPLSEGFQIIGIDPESLFGISISSAGDINNDGYEDIMIGAPLANPSTTGLVYVIYGKPSNVNIDLTIPLSPSDGFIITPEIGGGQLGVSVNRAGDFNQDGIDDIIVGDPWADYNSLGNAGGAYVIYGKTGGFGGNINLNGLSTSDGFRILGILTDDNLGWSVGFAGDFNDDSIDDVIIGAYQADSGIKTNVGEVYIIYGKAGGPTNHLNLAGGLSVSDGLRITGQNTNDFFGWAVSTAGDINYDGISDIIAGAFFGDTPAGSDLGSAFVIYGKTSGYPSHIDLSSPLPTLTGFKIFGSTENMYFGNTLGFAGDVNGDGIDDTIISDSRATPAGHSATGMAHVIFGKAGDFSGDIDLNLGLSLSQGFKISGNLTGDLLGYSVSSAGDFNGDGVDDILIGAVQASRSGRTYNGGAYVLYGQANGFTQHIDLAMNLPSSSGFEIIGGMDGDNLGICVRSIGDMNNDGINDLMISAKGVDQIGISNSGAAYIIYSHYEPPPPPPPSPPTSCSTLNCISCMGSKCLLCKTNYLLYLGDGQCYFKDSCPSGTTANSTQCVDKLLESVGVVQALASKAATLVASAITLVSFTNPIGLLFAALGESLLYMKYMNLTYPPKLQYILNQPEAQLYTIQYITSAPEEMEDEIPNFPLADNFKRNDIDSSFLINFWSPLITLLMIAAAIVIACVGTYLAKSCRPVMSAIKRVKESLKWNYLIATFAGCYGPIALFSSFEFRTVQFGSFLEILSFIICVFMNSILLGILVKSFVIINTLAKEKNPRKLQRLRRKFRDFEVLFESFKSSSFSQQSYFLICCLRFYLLYAILGYLFEYPLIQAILINGQGILFLGYLCIKRPFESKFEFVETLILEFTFQVIHACVLGLAIADKIAPETSMHVVNLGDVMMICICVFVGVEFIYLIIQTIAILITLFKFVKSACRGKSRQKLARRRKAAAAPPLRNTIINNGTMNTQELSLTMSHSTRKRNLLRPIQPTVSSRQRDLSSGAYAINNETRNPENIYNIGRIRKRPGIDILYHQKDRRR